MNSKELFFVSLAIYCASLFFPVWAVKGSNPIYGYEALMIGWLGLLILDPRWFCNLIVIFTAISIFRKYNKNYTNICFLLAVIGATVVLGPYHGGPSMGTFALGEGTGLSIGGYLWVAALWLFSISAYLKGSELESGNNF